jgi:hypothetical protein
MLATLYGKQGLWFGLHDDPFSSAIHAAEIYSSPNGHVERWETLEHEGGIQQQ